MPNFKGVTVLGGAKMNRVSAIILAAALLIAAAPAWSQDANQRDERAGSPSCCGSMMGAAQNGSLTGQHMFILTVNWIDAKSGLVDGHR